MALDQRPTPTLPRPGWLPDEVAVAGRENVDPAHVARYDAKMDAHADAEVELLARHGLDAGAIVVDLGAGTGQFAIAAAARCRRVVAVDVSPPMLERLAAKLRERGVGNVEVVRAGFLTYDHAGPLADVVYSRFALHHLPDAWKAVALARVKRLLAPAGIFRLSDVVYDFPADEAPARFEAWCAQGGGDVEQEWLRGEYEDHVRDEQSTFAWLLEPMLERCGFAIRGVDRSPDGFVSDYLLAHADAR